MLVTFTTDAHKNILYFGEVAIRLITMMGHSGAVPSAILAKDVPQALTQLQDALLNVAEQPSSSPTDDDLVSLSHRALPLIDLLRDAKKQGCDVLWR